MNYKKNHVHALTENDSCTKCQALKIVPISLVPPDFHEIGILSGYRDPSASFKQGLASIFQIHNETLNIWTQIVPALYFILQLVLCFFHIGERFLLIYLSTATVFLLTSASAHTFSCLSSRARHICFFLDYVGISLYSCGCAICYYAFALPTDFLDIPSYVGIDFCDIYLFVSVFLCVWGTHISCQTRFWEPSLYRNFVRMASFAVSFFYLAIPIAWRLIKCDFWSDESLKSAECHSVNYWNLHLISTVSAGFLYVSHLPERVFHGCFDVIGHSHQLFHIFSAIASVAQYNALRIDLNDRKKELELLSHSPSVPLSLVCLSILVICNVTIFQKFCRRLYTQRKDRK